MPIKHVFECAIPDDPTAAAEGKIVPSHWNDEHTNPDIADVTGLQTALDGKADDAHSHAISDVTGLQTTLDNLSAGDFANGILLGNIQGSVSAPVAGKTKFIMRKIGHTGFPSYINENGTERLLATDRGACTRSEWTVINGSSAIGTNSFGWPADTTLLGSWTAIAVGGSNYYDRQRKVRIQHTAGTAANVCGFYASSTQWNIYYCGNGAGVGGFKFSTRFGIGDTIAGSAMFVGVSSNLGAPTTGVDPATLTNSVGVAKLASDDTQLYIVSGGSAPITPIPLGTDFPPLYSSSTGAYFLFSIYSDPNVYGKVAWYIKNLATGAFQSGLIEGGPVSAPGSSAVMAPRLWRTKPVTGTSQEVAINLSSITIEGY